MGKADGAQQVHFLTVSLNSLLLQGSYRNGKTEFQDFSRTIPGLFFILKGLNFFPILYKTMRKNALFSAGNIEGKRHTHLF